MVQFLSHEWFEQFSLAAAGAQLPGGDALGSPVTLRQRVTGGPGGEVEYRVRFGPGRITVNPPGEAAGAAAGAAPGAAPGEAAGAAAGAAPGASGVEIEVVQDYETAAAINRGELSPAAAFAAGRLRMSGQVGLLVAYRDHLLRLGDVFRHLRAETSY